ncbi:MAG: hypothetical protein ABIP94_21495 [Planctomycetota bacterium]
MTRGFWFQAPANGIVAALSVPNEAVQPFQVVEFIDLGLVAPPAFPGTVLGTQLFYSNNTAGGSTIATAIPIVAGNYYGVLGACLNAVGSGTSYNSYAGVTGAFASTILGIPTTLTRFGTQFGIGAGGNQPCWSEVGGTFCRVDVTVIPTGGGVVATNTILGKGYGQFASTYENFATAAAFDLSNTSFQFIQAGAGWVITAGTPLVAPSGSAIVLPLTDDSEVTQALASGGSVNVCSNGFISFGGSNGTSFTPDPTTFLNAAFETFRIWHDFNPAAVGSGQVKYEVVGGEDVFTWDGVYDFAGTSAANASTIQISVSGAPGSRTVRCKCGTVSTLGNGFLVGYSPAGASLNPGSVDISATPLPVVLPGTDRAELKLVGQTRPLIGTNWNLQVQNIPATTVFGINWYGLTDPNILDLGFLGLPGNQLRASLDVIQGPWVASGTFNYAFPVPNNVAFLNFQLCTQAAVFETPAVNAFGAVTSNGIRGNVGNL